MLQLFQPHFGAWILTLYSRLPPLSVFLLVAITETTLYRGLFPSMWLGRLLAHSMRRWRLFLEPLPHCTPLRVSFYSPFPLGALWGAAFDDVSFFPSRPWDTEDRVILGCISRPLGLSLHVLGNDSPQCGPWALMESGPGPQILWPHNSPSKSCCPDLRTERRVLMRSSLYHNLLILVIYQFQRLFVCPRHVLGTLEGETCLH